MTSGRRAAILFALLGAACVQGAKDSAGPKRSRFFEAIAPTGPETDGHEQCIGQDTPTPQPVPVPVPAPGPIFAEPHEANELAEGKGKGKSKGKGKGAIPPTPTQTPPTMPASSAAGWVPSTECEKIFGEPDSDQDTPTPQGKGKGKGALPPWATQTEAATLTVCLVVEPDGTSVPVSRWTRVEINQ